MFFFDDNDDWCLNEAKTKQKIYKFYYSRRSMILLCVGVFGETYKCHVLARKKNEFLQFILSSILFHHHHHHIHVLQLYTFTSLYMQYFFFFAYYLNNQNVSISHLYFAIIFFFSLTPFMLIFSPIFFRNSNFEIYHRITHHINILYISMIFYG